MKDYTPELLALLKEIWESVPASFAPEDPLVKRHAAALNAIPALIAKVEGKS